MLVGTIVALSASANAGPNYLNPDYAATTRIDRLVKDGECKQAVEALKPGLKSKQADVLLLAGTLFEEGICFKPDWVKAVSMYMLADEAGNRSAIPRLMGGYARAGRENGLALWWAAKSPMKKAFPANCIPKSDPDTDQDGFNEELEHMPAPLFQGCVYMVGVAGEIHSNGIYPLIAAQHGLSGSVLMEFTPAQGTINWHQDSLNIDERQHIGIRDLTKMELENPRVIKKSFLTYLTGKSEFALSRYKKPDSGIDPSFILKTMFIFKAAK